MRTGTAGVVVNLERWQIWLAVSLLLYPGLVMVAWSTYKSIRAKSPTAFLKLVFVSVMLTPLMMVFWLGFWLVVLMGMGLALTFWEPSQSAFQTLVAAVIVVVMSVATPMGWRYLNDEIPDVREVSL